MGTHWIKKHHLEPLRFNFCKTRLLQEFESQYFVEKEEENFHHNEGLSTQKALKLHALSSMEAIEEMGNPFLEQSEELIVLDTECSG